MEKEQLESLDCTPPGPRLAFRVLRVLGLQMSQACALPLPLTSGDQGCKPQKVGDTLSLFACYHHQHFITSLVCCPSLYSSMERDNAS